MELLKVLGISNIGTDTILEVRISLTPSSYPIVSIDTINIIGVNNTTQIFELRSKALDE